VADLSARLTSSFSFVISQEVWSSTPPMAIVYFWAFVSFPDLDPNVFFDGFMSLLLSWLT